MSSSVAAQSQSKLNGLCQSKGEVSVYAADNLFEPI